MTSGAVENAELKLAQLDTHWTSVWELSFESTVWSCGRSVAWFTLSARSN